MLRRLTQYTEQFQRPVTTLVNNVKMAAPASDITLYTSQTPNGIKISIALEELG